METHVDEAEDDHVGAPRRGVPAGVGAAAPHHLGPVLPDAETSHGETGRIGPNQHGIEMKGAWEPRRGGRRTWDSVAGSKPTSAKRTPAKRRSSPSPSPTPSSSPSCGRMDEDPGRRDGTGVGFEDLGLVRSSSREVGMGRTEGGIFVAFGPGGKVRDRNLVSAGYARFARRMGRAGWFESRGRESFGP